MIQNVESVFDLTEKKYLLFRDYSLLISEAKHKAEYGRSFKTLTPKQMLQRLPIALEQVKAANTSENLLNETRQMIYSLYLPKKNY